MQEKLQRNLKCPKCGTEWESRVAEPRECPHCKKRLDWTIGDYVLPGNGGVNDTNNNIAAD